MSDPQWEHLQQAWQEPPSAQLPQLEKLLKKRTPAIWALTGIDAAGTLLVLGALAWWILHSDPTPSELGWSVFLAGLLVLAWAAVLLIRRGTWRADVAAPAAMVELSIRRCRASIKLALMNQIALLLIVVLGIGVWAADISAPRMGVEVTNLMRMGAIAFLAGLFTVSALYKRRKQAELKRLEALREEF